ncbi:MAG: DUF6641 family protein [Methylocystis sp.]
MAILDQLKLSNAARGKQNSPVQRFRHRLIEAIQVQIDLAKADIADQPLQRTRRKWVKVGAAGEKELRQVPVRVRRWWWKDESGATFVTLKYGATPLELAPGKSAIEVGGLEDLPTKLTLICDAIRAGELDGCRAKIPSFGRASLTKPKGPVALSKHSGAKG